MSNEQIATAQDIQAQHRLKPVVDDGAKIEQYVATKIKHTEIKNKEK
jgi:hypothetical protein